MFFTYYSQSDSSRIKKFLYLSMKLMQAMKLFRYIKNAYYRLFFFFFRISKPNPFGGSHTDVFATCLAILPFSAVFFADTFTIEHFVSRFLFALPSFYKAFHLYIFIVIIALNYFIFYNKKRYLDIKNQFADENRKVRVRRTLLCILFSVLSMFSVAIFDAIFGRPTMG